MDYLDEDEMSDGFKFVRDQIAAVKAGKSLDAKKLLSLLYEQSKDSDTEMAIFKLAEAAKRKGDKSAKQFADVMRAAFEKHVAAIARKPRKWWEAGSRGYAMKTVRGDVAFAEPLLVKAMKGKADKDFLSDLILLVLQQDKARAKRMYETVQEAAKKKPEWVFPMPFVHPARK
jgi:hypothetical protein